jgi:hypothetical protein
MTARRTSPRSTAVCLLTAALLTGCYPFGARLGQFHFERGCSPLAVRPLQPPESTIVSHAIFVSGEGHALKPQVGRCASGMDSAEYGRYIGGILDGLHADSVQRRHAPKILVRIHGGLNTLNGALDASIAMNERIAKDKEAGFYPLFINWESGLISAYGEHLFRLRRGGRASGGKAMVSAAESPFVLAADLGGAAFRLPNTILTQALTINDGWWRGTQREMARLQPSTGRQREDSVDRDIDTTGASARANPPLAVADSTLFVAYAGAPRLAFSGESDANAATRRLASQSFAHLNTVAVSRQRYERKPIDLLLRGLPGLLFAVIPTRYFVMPWSRSTRSFSHSYHSTENVGVRVWRVMGWLPPKSVALGLLDGLGTPAWNTMHRRTTLMFRPENDVRDESRRVGRWVPPDGALAVLLDSLTRFTRTNPAYRITLVGHSMGAIVSTEILRHRDTLPIDNIVFMAAASSVHEVQESVFPYLRADTTRRFYNLTLHPWADQRETRFLGLAPYGSLLAWIDAYFGHTETRLDLMAGKYENVVHSAFVIPSDVRDRTHIRAFGYRSGKGCGRDDMPYQHGQFNDPSVPYWRELFWSPGPASCADVQLPSVAAAKAP